MRAISALVFILFQSSSLFALTRFEDLDKNPVGAYGGQVFFGASIGLGIPTGSAIEAEDSFIDGTTYTFTGQETTRTVVVSHLNYSVSLFSEYMFIDHLGARLTVDRNMVIQRTHFGKNYKNESFPLYQDISLMLGPAYHVTVREPWDVLISPQIGVAFAQYTPAPCADELFTGFSQPKTFDQTIFVYGAALHGVYYFNNGVFISAGVTYTHIDLSYDSFDRTTPEPQQNFNGGKSRSTLGLFRFLLSSGYALYN